MQQQQTPKQSVYVPPHISRNKLKCTETVQQQQPIEGSVQQIKHFDSGYDLLKGQKWSDVLED